jgi:hypothetical protein
LAATFTRAKALKAEDPGYESTILLFLRPEVCDFISNSYQDIAYGKELAFDNPFVTKIELAPNVVGLYPILDDPETESWSLLATSIGGKENLGKGNGPASKIQRVLVRIDAEKVAAHLENLLTGDADSLDFRYVAHVHSTDEVIIVTGNTSSVDPKTATTQSLYKVYSLPFKTLTEIKSETTLAKLGIKPVLETKAPEDGLLLGLYIDQPNNQAWFAHGDKIEIFDRGGPNPSWTPTRVFTKEDLGGDADSQLISVALSSESQLSPVNNVVYGTAHPPLASGNRDSEEIARAALTPKEEAPKEETPKEETKKEETKKES